MIISDRSRGPIYSYDPSARDLHVMLGTSGAWLVSPDEAPPAAHAENPTRTFDFERLYPGLVPTPETDVRPWRFLEAIGRAFATVLHPMHRV